MIPFKRMPTELLKVISNQNGGTTINIQTNKLRGNEPQWYLQCLENKFTQYYNLISSVLSNENLPLGGQKYILYRFLTTIANMLSSTLDFTLETAVQELETMDPPLINKPPNAETSRRHSSSTDTLVSFITAFWPLDTSNQFSAFPAAGSRG